MEPLVATRWVTLVQEQIDSGTYAKSQEIGKESVDWYRNREQYDKGDKTRWNSDLVRGNLWFRNIRTMKAAILGEEPRISVQSTLRDETQRNAAAAISAMVSKVATETKLWQQVQYAYIHAKHYGRSHCRLAWDQHRGLPRFDWCDGDVVWDPNGKGMPERSRWVAEVLERSLSDVLMDPMIPKHMRKKLRIHITLKDELDYNETIKLYYIWSKNGSQPWIKPEGRKLIILCDKMDSEPLLVDDWPWPFLDLDEFPIKKLNIDFIPGEEYGALDFEVTKPLLRQYNWTSSFLQASLRREATKKVLHTGSIKEAAKLTSGVHMEAIEVEANDTKGAVEVIDFSGPGSGHVLAGLQFVKSQYDEQTGHTDVVRGQALGGRTTAEETRTLNQNASLIFQDEGATVDVFLNEVVRTLALAILYYIPQWSRVVAEKLDGTGNEYVTKIFDEEINDFVMVPAAAKEQEDLRPANDYPLDFIARAGVDAWVGDHHASVWLDYDTEQLRRDFSFVIEAGTARAKQKQEDQRNALSLLSTLGPVYQQVGAMEQYHALITYFVQSHRVPDPERFIPPMEMMMAQPTMMPQGSGPGGGGAPGGDNARPDQQPSEQRQGMGSSKLNSAGDSFAQPAGDLELQR